MNNKGFAITTILYGTLILFSLLLVSMLGILSTYRGNLEKLIDNDNAARDIVTMTSQNESSYNGCRGLYCGEDGCEYKTSTADCFGKNEENDSDNEEYIGNSISYSSISSNYSCANSSTGDNPIFTYTGDCEIVKIDNIDWKIRFLSSGNLVFNNDIYIEAFLVGAGGFGTCDVMGAYDTWSCASGGGGYHTVTEHSIVNGTTYDITIGQADGGATSSFGTTVSGGANGRVTGSDSYSGSGGEACYEFEEETGDTLYSGVHDERGVIPPEGTGRGGWHTSKTYGTTSGASGIVILRPKKSEVMITYNNNGGTGCGIKYAMFGDVYGELCMPTRDGYDFAGWYTSNDYTTEVKSTDIVPTSSSINLYAYWIEETGPLILLDGGDVTDVTGGWQFNGNWTSGWYFAGNGNLVYSKNADAWSGPYYHVAVSKNKIDLTTYSTFNVTFSNISATTPRIVIANTSNYSGKIDDSSVLAYTKCSAVGTCSIDITKLMDKYNVAISLTEDHIYGTSTATISKIWLE